MQREIKRCLALGAVLAGLSVAEPSSTITVFVYNYASIPPDVLAQTEAEAARIYRRAGIEIQWLDCPLSPAEASRFPACQVPPGPTKLALRMLSQAMVERFQRLSRRLPKAPDSLGFWPCPVDGGFGTVANIFVRDAEHLASRRGMRPQVILGHVVAHELGHLVLGEGRHSSSGIMRSHWGLKELDLVAQGLMVFMPREAEKMRTNIRARTAEESRVQATLRAGKRQD